MREVFVEAALRHLGSPSRRYTTPESGSSPSEGFDCSGFIVYLLREIGIPNQMCLRHASELFDHFGVLVHQELRQRGDLVFFSRNGLVPTHVGILTGLNTYIHAPGQDGTVVSCAALKFTGIAQREGQMLYLVNPIGFKRIAIPSGRYQEVAQ